MYNSSTSLEVITNQTEVFFWDTRYTLAVHAIVLLVSAVYIPVYCFSQSLLYSDCFSSALITALSHSYVLRLEYVS